MDRLTLNPCGNKAGCRLTKSKNAECCYAGCVNFQKVLDRLAAYEDTGFTPEELHKRRILLKAVNGTMEDE